jgi:hypothetical protein
MPPKGRRGTGMSISNEAIEAAANALDPQTMGSGGALAEKFKAETRAEARRILEAAAQYLLADVWEEAVEAKSQHPNPPNPYRPTQ